MVKPKINDETPEQRFIRLATARTQVVIDKIRILGNCADKHRYKYSKKQVNKIFNAIQKELDRAKARFEDLESEKFHL